MSSCPNPLFDNFRLLRVTAGINVDIFLRQFFFPFAVVGSLPPTLPQLRIAGFWPLVTKLNAGFDNRLCIIVIVLVNCLSCKPSGALFWILMWVDGWMSSDTNRTGGGALMMFKFASSSGCSQHQNTGSRQQIDLGRGFQHRTVSENAPYLNTEYLSCF